MKSKQINEIKLDKIHESTARTWSYPHYYYYYYFFKPSKNEGREKIEKVKKNGEANVPSGRPTQNYCATKQNWNEITKQKCVETKTIIIIIIII